MHTHKLCLLIVIAAALALTTTGCGPPALSPGHLRLVVMNVGEAESILVQTPDAACLIDAGDPSSSPEILRTLGKCGVHGLDLVVLSHPHADHTGGFLGLRRAQKIRQVLESGFSDESVLQRRIGTWLQASRIPHRRARAGQKIRLGREVTMDVLWPPAQYVRGTESDANNNSVVLRVNHGRVHLLLVGDLQAEGEGRLLSAGVPVSAGFLKVGHQGSRGASSDEFLARVRPRLAAIAAGKHNVYGHPAKETLMRLSRVGAAVYRTDRDGVLTFESDGRSIWRSSL